MVSVNFSHMILKEVTAFIIDRRYQKRAENTIIFYESRLFPWVKWCQQNNIETVEEITPANLRAFFYNLKGTPGGQHAYWRSIKAFLNWWESETEPENWRNPIKKVDPPKIQQDPIRGITEEEFIRVISFCDKSFYGIRDRAILYFLYDTGVRVTELCNILISDFDIKTGIVLVRITKNKKPRYVFLGNTCRREVIRYLRKRDYTEKSYLFSHQDEAPFTREGIGSILEKYNKLAGVKSNPSPHDYRRAWFHNTRKRVDDVTTARVGGHSNTALLPRYDYQDVEDLQAAIAGSSPLDNLK